MGRARTGSIQLHYDVAGDGEPTLLIHGALIADAMRPLATGPALAGFRCITYHRRGYGQSGGGDGPITIEQAADDAVAVLDALDVPSAHVVGHSSGALVALGVALRHPGRTRALALLEPPLLQSDAGAAFMEGVASVVERYVAGDHAGAVEEFLGAVGDEHWRANLDRTVPNAWAQAVADAATMFERELPGVSAWSFGQKEARQVEPPVLLVEGTRTSPFFVESDRLLRSWLPSSQTASIEGATHLLQLEQPSLVADAIAAFLSASQTAPARR